MNIWTTMRYGSRMMRLVVTGMLGILLLGLAGRNIARAGEPIHLFNGKEPDHFYSYLRGIGLDKDPHAVFTIQRGVLRVSGEDWGTLMTRKEYDNYHLIVEYRWGDETMGDRANKARDSGVWVHSIGEEGARGDAWMLGIEVNVIEGGTGDLLVIGDGSDTFAATALVRTDEQPNRYVFDLNGEALTLHEGRINWWGRDPGWQDVKGYRGSRDVEKPPGHWNRLDIYALGRNISVILNDVLVNQASQVRPYRGKIQIQSEGAEIFYRRIELIPVED
ncbi:MAG TPA: DUF1080 domain-containing protein [bacterium]|nr:DUF1080 domain-containing protein [bacterium]